MRAAESTPKGQRRSIRGLMQDTDILLGEIQFASP